MRIGCLNIWSLENKIPDLINLLQNEKEVLMFGINETKLKDKITNNSLQIPDFSFIRKDKSKDGHTGIGVYIHNDIHQFTKRRSDLESDFIESIWIELRIPKEQPVLVGFIYRHPSSNISWYDQFDKMIDKVNKSNQNILLLGDFNINHVTNNNKRWNSITEVIGLKQYITEPTRFENQKGSILDHIYCNNTNLITESEVGNYSISDHQPIFCSLSLKLPKNIKKGHTFRMYRNFKNFSSSSFLDDLREIDFSEVMNCDNPDEAAELFLQLLLVVIDKHAPVKKRRVKQTVIPGWLTENIKEEMKIRDEIKKKHGKCDAYKKCRNKVTELIRKSKKAYFDKLASDINSNICNIWNAINTFTNKKRKQKNNQSHLFTVNEINEYFLSLTKNVLIDNNNDVTDEQLPSTKLKEFCNKHISKNDEFEIPLLSIDEVEKLILKLKNKPTMDIYYLNSFILKLAIPYITIPLTYIYNLCITKCIFPHSFKIAKIIPIPKSKETDKLNNFRPISILPILSKPLERHIHNHMTKFLEERSLIHPFQSGFRQFHSCHTALVNICDNWLNGINNNNLIGAVFLDLRKAFDLVNHDILNKKLQCYLKNDLACEFIQSYLSDRYQSVYLNGYFSKYGLISCGVPQGSILGPLLFCLHINDLPLYITNPSVILEMFADDTTVHTEHTDIHQIQNLLQQSLNEIQTWTIQNKMAINPQKSNSMVLTTRQKRQLHNYKLNLTISNQNIDQTEEHKLLGIVIDHNLCWSNHIEFLRKKLSRNIHLLYKLEPIVSHKALRIFFFSHCMTHIDYASTVWCYASKTNMKNIDYLHRRALKIMNRNAPKITNNRYTNLDILPLTTHFDYNTSLLMYKTIHEQTPTYLQNIIIKSQSTRSCRYIIPYIRIELYKQSFRYQGSILWNKLPINCKNAKTIQSFKRKIKLYLKKDIQ